MTEQGLYTLLSSDAGITAITTRIYNGWLPETTVFPAVTFEYVSDEAINTLPGDTGNEHSRYTINAWSYNYAEAQALRTAIQAAMAAHPRQVTLPLHDEESKLYRFAIDYRVFN